MLGRARMNGGRMDSQGQGVFEVLVDKAVAQFLDGDALLVGALDHLIVDVGKVLAERNVVTSVFEVAAQCIKSYERAGISQVEVVIYRRAASVELDFALLHRDEFFFHSCQRIKNLHVISSMVFHQIRFSSGTNTAGSCAKAVLIAPTRRYRQHNIARERPRWRRS